MIYDAPKCSCQSENTVLVEKCDGSRPTTRRCLDCRRIFDARKVFVPAPS